LNEKLTPLAEGYRMPAEWEPHEGTWLQWPQENLYRGYELKLERLWLMMTEVLADKENVHLVVADQAQQEHVGAQLRYFGIGQQNIDFHLIPTEDIWARDNGPIFITNPAGEVAITDWNFNGWGERFPHALDKQVPGMIGEQINCTVFNPPMVLEGGAVEVDGQGMMMATRTSIIDPHRNSGMKQEDIEKVLKDYLGVNSILWLEGAGRGECEKWGDTTDSHIDIVARFTPQKALFYNFTEDPTDPRYAMFQTHKQELERLRKQSGLAYTPVPLPVPVGGVFQVSGEIDWRATGFSDAAYSNYYLANGVVLVPVFGNKADQEAMAIISEHFPDREVVGLDCVGLTEDGGAIHCVTQQQPAGRLANRDGE
jgi:agmatine deiminase